MMRKSYMLLFLGLLSYAAILMSCGSNSATSTTADSPAPATNGTLVSTLVLGKVGALEKSAAINLSKLIVTAISSTTPPDTVRDTSAVSGNAQVTVTRTYTLKPLRNWTLTAKSLDAKDSVIHTGSTAAFFVKPADTAVVSLNLSSRFSMYEARFNTLPDSVAAGTAGTGKASVKITRVTLTVDGVARADSVYSAGFTSGQTVVIFYDYITPGTHTALLEATGIMGTFTGVLYSYSAPITVAAGLDNTQAFTLNWVGPTTGTGKLSVTLGKVGKVTINGALPGTILP